MIGYSPYFSHKLPKDVIMIEVGAAGPDYLSQSKPFRNVGCRCIHVEPNPKFAQMYRDAGNEIYEYAISNFDSDDVDFDIVTQNGNYGLITNESFSSLHVEDDWVVKVSSGGYTGRESLKIETIKVKVRKLDTLLEELQISNIDFLAVDVEGYEMDVIEGFSFLKYRPKAVVLENNISEDQPRFAEYMKVYGYECVSKQDTNYLYINEEF